MKTSVLSQEGNMQLILTPETKFEEDIISKYKNDFIKVEAFKGNFADCHGGWTRVFQQKDSLILRINENKGEQ